MLHHRLLAVLTAFLLLLTQGSFAMIQELPLSELVAAADVIVIAELKDKTSLEPDQDGVAQVKNSLSVVETLKGDCAAADLVTVMTLSGWEDSVEFEAGRKAVVFLNIQEGSDPLGYEVTNFVQGHWPLDDQGKPTGMGTGVSIAQLQAEIAKNLPKPLPQPIPEPEF